MGNLMVTLCLEKTRSVTKMDCYSQSGVFYSLGAVFPVMDTHVAPQSTLNAENFTNLWGSLEPYVS